MTTHRAPRTAADTAPPVERAVMIGLVLGVLAGFAWIGGMLYTVFG
ncbi:morphogenic membrane protein MmpA [Streptomyces cavernae]|nr:hypothetical protein [Streptomyces cavernae]